MVENGSFADYGNESNAFAFAIAVEQCSETLQHLTINEIIINWFHHAQSEIEQSTNLTNILRE